MFAKRLAPALLTAAFLFLAAFPAKAQAYQLAQDWNFRIAPYYWLASLNGAISYSGLSADLSANTGSWPGSAQSSLMVQAEALYLRHFGILAEFTSVNLSRSPSISMVNADIGIDAKVLDLCAFYRLGELGGQNPSAALDIFAGGRLWKAKLDLSASLMGLSASLSRDRSWIDPLVGARVVVGLGPHLEAVLRGAIGGFGMGSELTWDAAATLSWIFCENARLTLGYRALSLRDNSATSLGATLDATLHGPIIGLGISF
jgi:hypothetical protein